MPQPGYVADPKFGSNHNRGAAVDLTLVTLDGRAGGDADPVRRLHARGAPRLPGGTEASRQHREMLREAMEGAGFKRNPMEWWHYDLPEPRSSRAGRALHPAQVGD